MPERATKAAVLAGLALAAVTLGSVAQAEPVFSPAATETCLRDALSVSPGLGGHGVLDCVGRAAAACMMTPGGDTTIGMMECLDAERAYWDLRLNAAYADRVARAQSQDTELKAMGSAAASIKDSLREMQRA